MEYEKCYVYEPESKRPTKRRKTEHQGLHASWKLRHQAYEAAWEEWKAKIDKHLKQIYSQAVNQVTHFLDEALERDNKEIPTAILSTDPDASSYLAVVDELSSNKELTKRRDFVSLTASTGPNLKALLKAIIQKATARQVGVDDEDDDLPAQKKGSRLLNYDLQILADHVEERHLDQVIVAIGETEAFDNSLLSDLIEHLRCWYDRIPFVLLLSVATSPDSLQHRLSSVAISCLEGQLLEIATEQSERESTIEAVIEDQPAVWIGADLMKLMLERQSDFIQSNDSFVRALQYAYMSHYYANALTIFLIPNIQLQDVPKDHFDALRNVDSFRTYCREALDAKRATEVRDLLDSDDHLFNVAQEKIQEARDKLSEMMTVVRFLQDIQQNLQPPSAAQPARTPFSTLYNLALAGRLNSSSSLIRTMLLTIRKSPASVITRLLNLDIPDIRRDFRTRCETLKEELTDLTGTTENGEELRSSYSVQNSTLRTTVVAQKVELSKQKATLSKQDEAYTSLLKHYSDLLEELFTNTLIYPKSLPFHELILYDLRSPFRETFTPKPRHAVERALAAPHDYLDCECCSPENLGTGDEETTLSAIQPATAVLYQLYLESGSLINVSDLQQAFSVVISEDGREEGEVAALFQRALAEMRYLGLVKGTRKRVDHVAKVGWRGL